MCATSSRGSSRGAHRDPDRNHHQHPRIQAPHLAPHPYYLPSPYARYSPYDPYAAYHYPGPFYPSTCYVQRDVTKEETTVWSWPIIFFLVLLVIASIGIVYRNFPRRKLAVWLRLLRFQPQVISHLDYISQTTWIHGLAKLYSIA